jgi:hypothetical protein
MLLDRRLYSVETIIQRQQRVLAKGNDHGLFLDRTGGRAHGLRLHRRIVDKSPLAPLGHGFLVEAVPGG